MGYKVGIPVMKCSLHPSQQVNSRTGKAAKTCGVEAAWREMNDERVGRDVTIDRDLTRNNVWMVGSTSDDLPKKVQKEIDRINEERRSAGKRALRRDTVSVIQIVEKPPVEFMQTLSPEEQKQFLQDSHVVMSDLIHEWNSDWRILAAVQHHDEWGGRSPHTHTMIMTSTVDENGLPAMNAKKEVNLKFYNHINKQYPERMRQFGYDIENCRTYDQLTEEEKQERRLNPPEHGKDAYEYKRERKEQLTKEISELEAKKEIITQEMGKEKELLQDARQQVDEMTSESLSLFGDLEEAQEQLSDTRREIGDLHAEKKELAEQTQKATEARNSYEQHAAAAQEKERMYDNKLLQLTDAPSVKSYENVLQENKILREELSLKDKIIERLTEERDHFREIADQLKETAVEWRNRFSDVAHRVGSRIMEMCGYDVSDDKTIKEYPDRDVSAGISEMTKSLDGIEVKQLRVIPDNNTPGAFRIACRDTDGQYRTVRDGFENRKQAEEWRRNVTDANREIFRSLDEDLSFGTSRHR